LLRAFAIKSGSPDKRYRIPFGEESFGNPVEKDLQILILPYAPYKINNFRFANALCGSENSQIRDFV